MPSDGLMLLGVGVAGMLLVVFAWDYLMERDAENAAARTSQRTFGLVTGASLATVAALAQGVTILADAPGLVLTALGAGAIAAGISWRMWLAVALLAYVIMAGVRGGY